MTSDNELRDSVVNTLSNTKLKELQEATGEFDIQVLAADWRSLMESGVVVKLHVRRWRAATTLSPTDLGIPASALGAVRKARWFTLGSKALLPERYTGKFQSLEVRGRNAVRQYSVDSPFGAFVPGKAYAAFKATIAGLRTEYFLLRDALLAEYDAVKNEVYMVFQDEMGRAFYRLCRILEIDPNSGEGQELRAGMGRNLLAELNRLFPTPDELRDSFSYEYELYAVPLLTMDGALQDAQGVMAEVRRDMKSSAQAQKSEMVDEFLRSCKATVNERLNDAVKDVLESVKKGGSLHARSIVQLKRLIENLEQLNFWNDREINAAIKEIQTILDAKPDAAPRSPVPLQASMDALVRFTDDIALNLERAPKLRVISEDDAAKWSVEGRKVQPRLEGVEGLPLAVGDDRPKAKRRAF